MTELFKGTYDTVIEFPDKPQDLSRYEREVTYVFSKRDWDTLVEELPDEWQGETISGFLCIQFGDESELYAKARMRFGLRFKRVITLRLLDWLMLAQSWALSANWEVRGFAAYIAKREFFTITSEFGILAQDFLGILDSCEEEEVLDNLVKEFNFYQKNFARDLRKRYATFRRGEKKDGK